MKNNVISKFFVHNSLKCKLLAVTLVVTLLLSFVGCDNQPSSSSQPNNSSSQIAGTSSDDSSDNEISDNDSVDGGNSNPQSSGNNTVGMTSSKIDPLDGQISMEFETQSLEISEYEQLGNYVPVVNGANLESGGKYVGLAEKEADKLREEILNTPNTEEIYDIKGTKYYISPNGKDDNTGRSPDDAFKTMDGLGTITLKEGDAVLFERDSIFRFYQGYSVKDGVIYGSYGEGRKPMLFGSVKNFVKSTWTPTNRKNIWRTSYTYEKTCNAVINEGEIVGRLRSKVTTLEKQGDFYLDENLAIMYLYCEGGNPSNVFDSIEFGIRSAAFSLGTRHHKITFDNLAFRYFSGGAIAGTYDCNYITITNCEMGYLGGGYFQGRTLRAGNGGTTWQGGKYYKWDHNWVYQIFDSGLSSQGNGGLLFPFENISMSNNLFEYNNCDIEIFDGGGGEQGENTGVWENLKMDGNIFRFTTLGWGSRKDDGGDRGIDGVLRGFFSNGKNVSANVKNISFQNNIIDCPGRYIMNFEQDEDDVKEWKISGNKYYVKGSYRFSDRIGLGHWNGWSGENFYDATDQDSLEVAIKAFDKNAKVIKWED